MSDSNTLTDPYTGGPMSNQITLSKYERRNYVEQTIMVTGNVFIECRFTNCVMIFRGEPFTLDNCRFERCNWIIDVSLLWGSPGSWRPLGKIIEMLEKGHQPPPGGGGGGGDEPPQPGPPPPPSEPKREEQPVPTVEWSPSRGSLN